MTIILSLFRWMLDASLRASLLAGAILLLQAALRGSISARWRYALWLPMLLVLTLPVLPQSRWSVENLFTPLTHAAAPVSVEVVQELAPATPVSSVSSLEWKEEVAGIVWAAGVALSLGGGLVLYMGMVRRFMLKAEQPDGSLTRLIGSLCAELQLRHSPRVILSQAVESPAVTGLLRPVLLLPADFAATFAEKEARLVLKHELMHLKRFDLQINALVCFLNALHWFNPGLWLAAWRARQDREAACDAQVLASEPRDCRGDYGNVLLKVQSAHCAHWLSVGFVGIFEAGRVMRSRIEAVARYRRPSPAGGIMAAAAIVLLGALGATHAQTDQPPPAATPAAEATTDGGTQSIQNKLNRIVIPEVDLHDATVNEAVYYLTQKSIACDTTEADPSRRGVHIVSTGDAHGSRLTLSLRDTPLLKAITYIARLSGLEMKVDAGGVLLFQPPNSVP